MLKRSMLIVVLLGMTAFPTLAADRAKIRSINIGAQAVTTLITGAIQGKIRRPADVWRCLGSGAAAGYGFYEAKVRVARGDVQSGWLLANLATSISENAAAGRNPVSQIGYTIGPVRVRIPIGPLDRTADAYAYVDFSEYQAIKAIQFYRVNDSVNWRDGMIAFERDSLYPAGDGAGPYDGRAFGIFPGVWRHATREVWRHEVIHAIQSLQGDAVEPSFRFLTYKPAPRERKRIVRFEHFKSGVLHVVSDEVTYRSDYENRWTEIEAYRLAQDATP